MEKEKCVSCWKETEYNFSTPIDKRQYYIETVGQLCKGCYNMIYGTTENIEVIESKDFILKK